MRNERSPLRRTLLIYFVVIIAMISSLNFSSISIMWRNYRSTENMFQSVFYTTSLSLSLDDTHQSLKNLINYQDEKLIADFETRLEKLVADVKNLDSTMLEYARNADDMNTYYSFLDMQSKLLAYSEKSKVLVARFKSHTERLLLYDFLYKLKDEVDDIKIMQASLLFRQSVYTREFYSAFEKVILRSTIIIIVLTVSIILFAIILAFRFSSSISRPIHKLAVFTSEIGMGKFLEIEKEENMNAEIEMLFNSVDKMSARLRNLISEIEKKADIERLLKEEEIKNLRTENLLHQTEMELLQSQINPHFLFNTLNMVSTLTQIEHAKQSGMMIESLSNILRYILKRDVKKTYLSDEIAVIDDYMYIQQTRFGERIKFIKSIEQETLDVSVPPLSLQPFIENAIIHGLEPKLGNGTLELISGTFQDGEERKLKILIKDDGVGMGKEILEKIRNYADPRQKRRSLGILNSMKRLEMIYGKNVIAIESEPGKGSTVEIVLPLS